MATADQPGGQENPWTIQPDILQHVSDAVLIFDLNLRIKFWNRAATAMFGWEAAEVAEKTSRDVFTEVRYLDGSPRTATIDHVVTTGAFRGEVELRRRDGQLIIVDAATQLLRDAAGNPVALVNINHDITERKRAEAEAQAQLARTAMLAEFARTLTEAGLSQAAIVDVLGERIATLVGASCVVQLAAADGRTLLPGVERHGQSTAPGLGLNPAHSAALADRAMATGQPQRLAPDDAPADLLCIPLQAGGVTLGVITVERRGDAAPYDAHDIASVEALAHQGALAIASARLYEQAQAALASQAAAQRRLEAVASTTRAVAAAQLDAAEVLDAIVQRVAELIGDGCAVCLLPDLGNEALPDAAYHPNPDALRVFRDILEEAPLELGAGLMSHVVRSGTPVFVPSFAASVDQLDIRPAYWRYIERFGLHSLLIVPLAAQERRIGCLVLVRDATPLAYTAADMQLAQEIADRVAIAIQNARLYRAAQAAIKARDNFISIAAHELKTPLAALRGFTWVLGRRVDSGQPLSERDVRALRMVDDQAERLDRLVSALLDVARLEAGTLQLEHAPVDLCGLVQRVVAEIEPTLERHVVQVDCPRDSVWVRGDSMRLEQVIQNLLQNGLKYSPRGGTITVQLVEDAAEARISVRDAGIGIPAADQAKLFQQFFRARNAAPSQIGGLGIGLYVVQEIVARHGGTIEVASKEGVGSTFTVRLPRGAPLA